jgi:Tfp pilus assembly protein PilO
MSVTTHKAQGRTKARTRTRAICLWVFVYLILGAVLYGGWVFVYHPVVRSAQNKQRQYLKAKAFLRSLRRVNLRRLDRLVYQDELLKPEGFSLTFQKALSSSSELTLVDFTQGDAKRVALSSVFEKGSSVLYSNKTVTKMAYSIQLMGKYMDLLKFLYKVKDIKGLFWLGLSFDMRDYPVGLIKINVYILGR